MGRCLWLQINKSGQTYPVYDTQRGHIGDIYDREAYILYGMEGSMYNIIFLSPTGFTSAMIQTGSHPMPKGFETWCTDYPYRTEKIDGKTYKTFYMRRTMPIYTADAAYWGSVAAGMRVATNNNTVGETHNDWKQIDYVLRTDGKWIKVDGAGYDYGFVDTGITTGSGYNSIDFYGSW